MFERALEVYKWILYNINGYSEEEIENLDLEGEYDLSRIVEIIEYGRKYNEV